MSQLRRAGASAIALLLAAPLALVLTMAPSGAQTSTTVAPTPQEKAAAIVQPSIVYLGIDIQYYLDTGYSGAGYIGPYELQGSCTGFYVSATGYIETAGHCVDLKPGSVLWDDAIKNALASEVAAGTITQAEGESLLSDALGLWKVEGAAAGSSAQLTVTVQTPIGVSGQQAAASKNARVVEAIGFDEGDVALIKTEEANAPVLLLGSDADVAIGTQVLAAGYPGAERKVIDPNVSPTFKDGQINTKGTMSGVKVPVYEMSAALSPGMSGGPTVALDGRLVGVNSSTLNANQNFNFIAPVSLVKEQLARNDVKNELGPVDTAYRAGLDAYYSGDYAEAVKQFDTALGIAPGNFYAQQFKQKANEKLASAPPTTAAAKPTSSSSSSNTGLLIGLGVLVLLVIIVVVVLVAMRGRNKGGAPPQPGAPGMAPTTPAAPPMAPPPAAPTAPSQAPAEAGSSVATAPMPTTPAPDAGAAAGGASSFCSSCGHQVAPGESFCPSCGKDLRSSF